MKTASIERRGTRRVTSILGLFLSLAVLGGVAVAQTTAPSSIVACVHKTTGNLRVVDSADECRPQETALQWSLEGGTPGPGGPEGPQGPAGPQGPQGLPGISVAGQRCPAGQFVVGFEADGDLICEAPGGGGGDTIFYRDADSDGFGDPGQTTQATSAPAGYVAIGTDCDDDNASVNPGAAEVAGNNIDDNCNSEVDEEVEVPPTFYRDADDDGYGDPATTQTGFAPGWVEDNTDCDDDRAATNPGAREVVGNNLDDNCNGETDEGLLYLESFTLTPQTIYARTGGFGDSLVPTHAVGKLVLESPMASDVVVQITTEMTSDGVVSVPANVVITAGQTEAEFNVIGTAPGSAEISATLNDNSLTQDLTVLDQNSRS